MLRRIFPAQIDNVYRGHKLALLLLVVVVIFKTMMAYNSLFDTRFIMIHADGIPLDSYPPDAAQTAVTLFALLGNINFIITLFCVLALVRYRAMTSLMFLVLIYEYLTRKAINHYFDDMPWFQWPSGIASTVVQSLFVAMLVGFALSLRHRDPAA